MIWLIALILDFIGFYILFGKVTTGIKDYGWFLIFIIITGISHSMLYKRKD